MAKKSNKTAHVLNLISSPKQNKEVKNTDEEENSTQLDNEQTSENEKQQYSSLQTTLERSAKTEELSNKIKDNLLKELDENTKTENKQPQNTTHIKNNEINIISNNVIESVEEKKDDNQEFYFYNICEQLIKDKVTEYLEKFSICTCKRCTMDTIALALSNLTPKYVVTDDKDCVPFLSYYESKFSSNIMTELTKACLTVSELPRHKK